MGSRGVRRVYAVVEDVPLVAEELFRLEPVRVESVNKQSLEEVCRSVQGRNRIAVDHLCSASHPFAPVTRQLGLRSGADLTYCEVSLCIMSGLWVFPKRAHPCTTALFVGRVIKISKGLSS